MFWQANHWDREATAADGSGSGPGSSGPSTCAGPGSDRHMVRAVNQLHLSVDSGELLVILGPSGCGKSTTLRLIAGLETCDRGQILLDGQSAPTAPHQRNLALVFQESALFPHLTVAGNIAFGLGSKQDSGVFDVLRRMFRPTQPPTSVAGSRGLETRVRLTARKLGLESLLDRRPHQLSGGERQRVALGRAIVRNPAAFLLDEPLASVDQWQRVQLRTEIRRLQKQSSTTMIYVTHDQSEAFALADRVAVMNHGAIQQIGTPTEIYHQPKTVFVAGFIGGGQTNWLRICRGQYCWQDGAKRYLVPSTTDAVSSRGGIRIPVPQDIAPRVDDALKKAGCWLAVRPQGLVPVQGTVRQGVSRADGQRPTEDIPPETKDRNTGDGNTAEWKTQVLGTQFQGTHWLISVADWSRELGDQETADSGTREATASAQLPFGNQIAANDTDNGGEWWIHWPAYGSRWSEPETNWTVTNRAVTNRAETDQTVTEDRPSARATAEATGRDRDKWETENGEPEDGALPQIRYRPGSAPVVGDTIGLKFDPAHLHFFDLQTGRNLRKELDETQ